MFYEVNTFRLAFPLFLEVIREPMHTTCLHYIHHLRIAKPRHAIKETYTDIRNALVALDRYWDTVKRLRTLTIEYYDPFARVIDMLRPLHSPWNEPSGLRCVSVGRHSLSLPGRNLEIYFENPRTVAAWASVTNSESRFQTDPYTYNTVLKWRAWQAGATSKIFFLPQKCRTVASCHDFSTAMSVIAIRMFVNEMDSLQASHMNRPVGRRREPDSKAWYSMADRGTYRAENFWSQPGADNGRGSRREDFDRFKPRPRIMCISQTSSSEDLNGVTEMFNCNLPGEVMPTYFLRMVVDGMRDGKETVERRGREYYAELGDSRVWPGLEVEIEPEYQRREGEEGAESWSIRRHR